jgi:hypothetical protein
MSVIARSSLLDEELRKFSSLCFQLKSIMPMFSKLVDDHWHNIILKSSHQFDLPFHDTNLKSSTPINIEWVTYYERYYGALHKTWFMDKKGCILKDKYEFYLASGKVISSFNCAGRIE